MSAVRPKKGEELDASEAYYEYGRLLTVNFDFQRALKAVSNAIVYNPQSGKAYNLMGEIYYVNDTIPNNKAQAKGQFENAIKYSPGYYKPYANLGHIYYYNDLNFIDPDKALTEAFYNYKIANQLIDKDRKDFLLSYNLGWLFYKYNDYEDAFNEFMKLYIDEPYNPVLSYDMGNTFFNMKKLALSKIEYDKSIEYYEALAAKIGYINPALERHQEIYGQLARSYNNRGVVYSYLYKQNRQTDYEENALLDFYKAKDYANKINLIYNFAEYNIKYILNKGIRNKKPAIDNDLLKRTSLQKLVEEFRNKLISTI
jgi:tetratricopeptide (TPR) repeat protein